MEVKLTVGASSDDAKLKFLRALEESHQFSDIQLDSELPAKAGRPASRRADRGLFEELMKRDVKLQKRLVIGALALLVLADVALAAYSWRLSSAPHTPQQELVLQNQQLEVLRADIKRGESIRQLTPAIQRDCDRFEQSLLTGQQRVFVGIRGTRRNCKKSRGANRGTWF